MHGTERDDLLESRPPLTLVSAVPGEAVVDVRRRKKERKKRRHEKIRVKLCCFFLIFMVIGVKNI